jgi:hypothetical protein
MTGGDMVTGHASGLPGFFRSPLIRIMLIGFVAIILLILIVVVSALVMRSGLNHPIDVVTYPNAQLVTRTASQLSDLQTYSTTDPFQQVFSFYDQSIHKDDGSECKKIYSGAQASEEPGQVSGRCMVSHTFMDTMQFLSIKIDYVPDGNTGKTIILIERTWGG